MSDKTGRALINLIQECAGLEAEEFEDLMRETGGLSPKSAEELTLPELRILAQKLLHKIHIDMTHNLPRNDVAETLLPQA